jgi:hypothetical protein
MLSTDDDIDDRIAPIEEEEMQVIRVTVHMHERSYAARAA